MKFLSILCICSICLFSSAHAEERGMFEFNKEEVVDCLVELLMASSQNTYRDGPLNQLDHVLECAYFAAEVSDDEEFIVAALLHNIGFLCGEFEIDQSGTVEDLENKEMGVLFLADCGFSSRVCQLTKGSIEGKRYLAYSDPFYTKNLSPVELDALNKQGEVMTEEEALYFERDPLFKEKLLLCECVQSAHRTDITVPSLSTYTPLLEKYITLPE